MINVTGAIIICNKQILLAQRPEGERHGGLWEFAGGKQELNETIEECLLREIKEELGKEITIKQKFDEFIWTDERGDFCFHAFLCTTDTQDIPYLEAHQQYKWVNIDDLHNYSVLQGDKPSIKKLQSLGADLFKLINWP